MKDVIKKTLSVLLTVCFIISGLTISDSFVEIVIADELMPDLLITGLVSENPVIIVDQINTLVLTVANFGSADAKNVIANIFDVIPGENETLIDEIHFGMITFDEVKSSQEKQRLIDWEPEETGAHYIKVDITYEYLTHDSPAESVEMPPIVQSAGFPVVPFGTTEYWNPNTNGLNIVTLSEGIRYRDGPRIIYVQEGSLTIETGATLQLNESVTLIILQDELPTIRHNITIRNGASFIINSPINSSTITKSTGEPAEYTYPFHNSGTIDFTGASVSYTYGDKTNTANPGGIQNHEGSVCNLADCNILWADSHSVMAEDSEMVIHGADTKIGTDSDIGQNVGNGISVLGRSNVKLENIVVKKNMKNGIYVKGAEVSIKNCSVNNNTLNGIFVDGPSLQADISGNVISDNGVNGILLDSTHATNAGNVHDSWDSDSIDDSTILLKLKDRDLPFTTQAQIMSDIASCIDGKVEKEFQGCGVIKMKLLGNINVKQALYKLSKDSRVLYAEPDYRVYATSYPNDTYFFSHQWNLNNNGVGGGTYDADIDAPDAWNITTGNGDVVVAVIDSGIDYNHPDLIDNMWTNTLELNGNDGEDDDNNGYTDDIYGIDAYDNDTDPMGEFDEHGTHCAGIIGAVGNNSMGIAGVAWNVSLMALKYGDDVGFASTALECLEYATMMKLEHGVNIIATSNSYMFNFYSQAFYDAISASRDANILFIAGSGNDGWDNDYFSTHSYPAAYNLTNIITVTGTDRNDELDPGFNWGASSVDVAAPGVDIYSTVLHNSYAYRSGTSMATPHVTGLTALIASAYPSYNYTKIKNLIMTTVEPLPCLANKTVTGGRINAFNALSYVPSGVHMLVHSPGNTNAVLNGTPVDVVISVSDGVHPITDAFVNVTFSDAEPTIALYDDGLGVDQKAGDGYYSGSWIPQEIGVVTLNVLVSADGTNVSRDISVMVISDGLTISNNKCIHNKEGIYLYESNGNTICNNTVSGNSYKGFNLYVSIGNIIFNNNASYNNYYGFEIFGCWGNYFFNNTASTNNNNIYIYNSSQTIANSTLLNPGISDYYIDYGSRVTSLNTSFDESKVTFYDAKSTLTVQWFLQVGVVNETFDAVEGASVTFADSLGGDTVDSVTPSDGRVKWIHATEYVRNQTDITYNTANNITASKDALTGWAMPEPFIDKNMEVYVLLGAGGGYNIMLHEGWNLISLPFEPFDMSSDNLLDTLKPIEGKWDTVKWYDITDPSDPWKTYKVGGTANDLFHLNQTMGLWLYALVPCNLFAMGNPQLVTEIQLYTGWNLIGYPSATACLASDTFPTQVDYISIFNASAPSLLSDYSDLSLVTMAPGNGYFVRATENCVWSVDW